MSKIDERIVAMKFKSDQFLRGIKTALSSLDNFKQKLNFSGASKGLESITAASKNISLDHVTSGVDGLSAKFSSLAVVGVTALATIANKAVNAGLQLAKSLTISPISEGFSDYNAKLTSVQTIMNATGADIGTVDGYFKQLDTYSDKTIYNLKDMTGAFAKFTNAGVGMDKSVPAIKGIANMVALAGQGSEAAASAMYNLSQSIAGGFLTTTDYKSLNLANVATKEWKNQMIAGAVAAGKLQKIGGDAYHIVGTKAGASTTSAGLFNEELKEGWASSDVLLKVLGDYGNEQTAIGKKALAAAQDVKSLPMMMETLKASVGTGWTDTFETVLGTVPEATKLFTNMTNVIGGMLNASAAKRKWVLDEWKKAGGRDRIIDALSNAFKALMSVIKPIQDAFHQFFPTATGLQLNHYTMLFQKFTKGLILGKETADKLKRTFAGVFAIFRVVAEVIIGIARVFGSLFSTVGTGTGGILSFTAVIGDAVVWISQLLTKGGGLKKFFDILINVIGFVLAPLKYLVSLLMAVFGAIYRGVTILVQKSMGPLGKFFTLLADGVVNLVNWLRMLAEKALIPITAFVNHLSKAFSTFFKSLSRGSAIGTLGALFERLGEAFTALMKGDFSGFMNKIRASFSMLPALIEGVKADFARALRDFRTSTSDFASGFASDFMGTLANVFANISSFFAGLGPKIFEMSTVFAPFMFIVMNISDAFQKLQDKFNSFTVPKIDTGGLKGAAGEFKGAAGELSLMDKVGSRVSKIWDGIVNAFTNMKAFFAPIISNIGEIFTSMSDKITGFIKGMSFQEGVSLLNTGFFIAMYIMLRKFIGSMKGVFDSASGMFTSIGKTFDALSSSLKTMQNSVKAGMILKIGIAVGILAASIWVLSKIDPEEMKTALIAMSILFVELALMMALLSKMDFNSNVTKMGITMILLAIAIRILATAVKEMSGMDMEEMKKGLIGVGVLLAALTLFAKFASADKGGASAGVGLVLLAVAIKLLVGSVSDLGNMDTGVLIQGIIALGVMLFLLANIVVVFNQTKGIVQAAIGMLILAGALMALAIAIRIYSAFDQETFVEGLKKIAITLGVLAIAMWAMPKNIPVIAAGILTLSYALVILSGVIKFLGSMSLEEIGRGLLAIGGVLGIIVLAVLGLSKIKDGWALLLILAASLMTISKALVVFAAAMFILGKLSWTQMAIGLAAIGGVMAILVIGCYALRPVIGILISFAWVMKTLAIALIITGVGLLAVAVGLTALTAIGVAGFAVITAGLMGLLPLIPLLAEQLGLGMIAFAKVMKDAGPPLLAAFTVFLNALFQSIIDSTPKFIEACIVLLGGLLLAIIQLTPNIVEALLVLIGGFLKLIIDLTPKIIEAFLVIVGGLLQAVIDLTPKIIETVVVMIGGLLQAIIDLTPKVVETFLVLFEGLVTGLLGRVPIIVKAVMQMLTDIMTGITEKLPDFIKSGAEMIKAYLKGMNEELPDIIKGVGTLIVTFLEGITKELGPIIAAGTALVLALLEGIATSIADPKTGKGIVTAAVDVVIAFINGVATSIVRVADAGAKMIIAFINGIGDSIRENTPNMILAMENLGTAIVDGLAAAIRSGGRMVDYAAEQLGSALIAALRDALFSPLRSQKAFKVGMEIDKGLASGLSAYSSFVTNASETVGHTAIDAMRKSISGVSDLITEDIDMHPVITPILDLTDVQSNAGLLGNMLTTEPIAVDTSYSSANDISSKYSVPQTVPAQTLKDIQALTAVVAAKSLTPEGQLAPRPVEFHIGTVEDGDTLLRRARANDRMLSLAEGGDSPQMNGLGI